MKYIKNKRLRKKLHRKIIDDLCLDGSQSREWRIKLFQSKDGDIFDFTQEDLIALIRNEPMVRKFVFQFSVMVIPKNQPLVPLWLQHEVYDAVFMFYAKEFPEVYAISGNPNNDEI